MNFLNENTFNFGDLNNVEEFNKAEAMSWHIYGG
jgi:hypothetical protein